MNMKSFISFLFFFGLCYFFYFITHFIEEQKIVKQLSIAEIQAPTEGDDSRLQRYQWFNMLHRAKPGTDWRAIDKQTRLAKYKKRQQFRQENTLNRQLTETLANGNLIGNWKERGSNNQSGSIEVFDYTSDDDAVYGIGGGGTLFKGNLDGNNWTALNEDFQFGTHILKVIPHNGGKRILAAVGKVIYYSDDNGQSWTASTGFGFYGNWGDDDFWNRRQMVVLNDANNTIYYFTNTWDTTPWASRVWLFRSTDKGTTFTKIHTFSHGNYEEVSFWHPYQSEEVWVLDQNRINYLDGGSTLHFSSNTNGLLSSGDKLLTGHQNGSNNTMYTLVGSNKIYRSMDNGANWNFQGYAPHAWEVGISVALSDPNKIYLGAVNAYRSSDGGMSWTLVNDWTDYYWWDGGDGNALHADIMEIQSFKREDNTEFTLVANHGGLHVSYNNMQSHTNIAASGLNVSQYYDVLTNPSNTDYIYAGSQDQGHQVADDANSPGAIDFDQLWSGDYGQMVLTNNNQTLWTMYVNGVVNLYPDALTPLTHYPTRRWAMPGADRPANGWLLPTSNTSNPNANEILIAGGNIEGGSGSYLVKLNALTSTPYTITPSQYNYDFKAHSNSGAALISAIEASSIAPKIFVATSDGTFFYSNNNGSSWNKTLSFGGPPSYWLYGSCILASKLNSNLVYLSGSGYSNPGVYKSTNGGQTFTPMDTGLPNTLVVELAANADESLIFAATEVGPYVYVVTDDRWYDMMGMGAPQQFYHSVEFVNNGAGTVRFGTYGRGIWDFAMESSLAVEWTKLEAHWQEDKSIRLDWTVSNEKNNNHFIIERSADGQDFEAIGKVVSKGDSNAEQSYSFVDTAPLFKTTYYRLQQLDNNKEGSYSEIVSLNYEASNIFSLYPNPTIDKKLWISSGFDLEQIEVQLFNLEGKLLQSHQLGPHSNKLDLEHLTSGMYFIHLSSSKGKVVERVVVK